MQQPGRRDTIQFRHPNIHEHNIRAAACNNFQRFLAISGHPNNLQVGFHIKQSLNALAHQILIVDQHDSYHSAFSSARADGLAAANSAGCFSGTSISMR